MLDHEAVDAFRNRALNPEKPVLHGTAQNPDIFFQAREACNKYYDAVPEVVVKYMDKVNAKIGTDYKPFNYYGAEDAEHVIIAMGSVCDTIEETIDYMLVPQGKKVGLVKVRLYRPFSVDAFVSAIPETVKKITVLDRTKEPGALGEPLYLDVVAALKQAGKFQDVPVFTGRYGLGSKDTTPAHHHCLQYKQTQKSPDSQSVSRMTLQAFHCPSVRTPTQLPKVQPAVSSGVLVQTVLSVLTRTTLSRSSVTTQICMLRHTSHTTQRSQAVLRFLTFVSVSRLSSQLTL